MKIWRRCEVPPWVVINRKRWFYHAYSNIFRERSFNCYNDWYLPYINNMFYIHIILLRSGRNCVNYIHGFVIRVFLDKLIKIECKIKTSFTRNRFSRCLHTDACNRANLSTTNRVNFHLNKWNLADLRVVLNSVLSRVNIEHVLIHNWCSLSRNMFDNHKNIENYIILAISG